MATTTIELQWVLSKLLAPVQLLPTLFSNNFGATYIFVNPVFHSRMKHLAIDYHFVRDLVQSSELRVVHVFVGHQLANVLTKSLSQFRIFYLYNKITVIYDTPSKGGVLEYVLGFLLLVLFYYYFVFILVCVCVYIYIYIYIYNSTHTYQLMILLILNQNGTLGAHNKTII